MKNLPRHIIRLTVIIAAVVLLFPAPVNGQRKKVGVVLSGGGAKGVAHITALKVIEEAGIPIDYIAGTSMGAIIGALYAIGYDTHTLDSMVRTQDWTNLLSDRVPGRNLSFGARESGDRYMLTIPLNNEKKLRLPSGIVGGYNIYNLFYELTIGYHDSLSFRNLPIPFSCVAFDMVTGNPVVLDKGYLPDAMRASMSIPGAFQPVSNGEMLLVDGGVGNNFPADVVREMGAEIVIGIDVTAPLKTKEQLRSLPDIFDQIVSFTGQECYEKNLELVDLYVHPDIVPYNAASFSQAAIDTLLVRGEAAMRRSWDELIALKSEIGIPRDSPAIVRAATNPEKTLYIDRIEFVGLRAQKEKPLRRILGIKENSEITTDELHNAVSRLQGTDVLSEVHYRLEGHSPYSLTFIVKERTRNSLGIGIRFDTEEMAAILLNINLAARNMSNSYFDITGRLGNNPYAKGSWIMGGETKPMLTGSYMYRYNDLSLYHRSDKYTNLDFNNHQVDFNFSNLSLKKFKVDIGIRYDFYHYRSVLSLRESMADMIRSEGLISYYASARMETIDSRYYPRRGVSFVAEASLTTSNFVNYHGDPPSGAVALNFLAPISISKRVTFLPGLFGRVVIGNDAPFPVRNFFGGAVTARYMPQQFAFTGVHNFEMAQNTIIGAKLDFRVRLWTRNYVSVKLNYAKQEDDFFEIFEGTPMFGAGLNYSYNSFIGPIDLLLEYSNYTKKFGAYFNIGYYF